MFRRTLRSAWAEIDLKNLGYNVESIQSKVGLGSNIIGVIKADAYGHGAVMVSNVLREKGIDTFAVATIPEAIELRKAGATEEIIILGLIPDICIEAIVQYNLTPVVTSFEFASLLSNFARENETTIEGYLIIDTGMGRLGFMPDHPSTISEIYKIHCLDNFNIKGLFSHFATADKKDLDYLKVQEYRFETMTEDLREAGINIENRTFCNSGGIMQAPESYFNSVRPGIILYGVYPSEEVDKSILPLKPVMSIKANLVYIKKVQKGESIGYDRKFITERDTLVGIIPLGYADGLRRSYSSNGKVILNGRYAPIIGNICMDQAMVDLTDLPSASVGDTVTIMGEDGLLSITADDIARESDTISYEILCGFGMRLPKIYMK